MKKEMKKKAIICACAVSLLMCNCITATSVFAGTHSFIQKVENLQYDPEYTTEEKEVESGHPDTSWFDPDDQREVYEISTEQQLLGLAELVNTREMSWNVNKIYTFKDITIKLTKDIELTTDWTPIGSSDSHAFEGTFEGNGHTISGMKIDGSTNDNQGFFGYLKGTVNNLNVSGSIETRGSNVGGLVATMVKTAVVENCTTAVDVISKFNRVGGVVGFNVSGKIINCHNQGNIKGNVKIGGVVGENWNGHVEKCSNEGRVESEGKGVGTYGTGGIAGRSVAQGAVVKESFNKGNIYSENECAGGVVGYANAVGSTVDSCYNTGSVSGPKETEHPYGYVGGVVGSIGEDGVKLSNCYNTGTLKNGKYIGGVLGNYTADFYDDITASISNNYYLSGAVTTAVGKEKDGKGKNHSGSLSPKSSGDLRSTHMASSLGIAFRPDSSGLYGSNNGYPVLQWQEEEAIDRDALLKEMKIGYKKQFKGFYEKHPYGTASGDSILELFNPNLLLEKVLNSVEDIKKDE